MSCSIRDPSPRNFSIMTLSERVLWTIAKILSLLKVDLETKLSRWNFSQKMNERICFSILMTRKYLKLNFDFKFQVFPSRQDRKTNLFVCFWEKFTTRQFCFVKIKFRWKDLLNKIIKWRKSGSGIPPFFLHSQFKMVFVILWNTL